jgi:cytoskeletal protein CcmA (bactofilin family)
MAATEKNDSNIMQYVWPILRKTLFWGILSTIVLALLLIVLAILFEKKISKAAMAALKTHLRTELTVDEVSLSLIRGFPNATLSLKGVQIKAYGADQQLLKVDVLALKCGIINLLFGNYDFHTVVLTGGELNLYRAANGLTNYDVISPEAANNSADMFTISRLQLNDLRVNYKDERFWQKIGLTCTSVDMRSGDYKNDNGDDIGQFYYINGDIRTEYAIINGDSLLVGNALALSATTYYNQDSAYYKVENANVQLNASKLKFSGEWENIQDSTTGLLLGLDMNLILIGNEVKLRSVQPLLPIDYQAQLDGWESSTNMYATVSCVGELTAEKSPVFTALLGMRSGKLEHEQLTGVAREVNGELTYTNRDEAYEEVQLKLQDFSAKVGGTLLAADYTRSGVNNPHISATFRGGINLAAVYKLISKDISAASGVIEVDSLKVEGFYSDMLSPAEQARVQLLGKAKFNSLSFVYGGRSLTIDKGAIIFKGNSATLEEIKINTDKSAFSLAGNIANILPVYMAGGGRDYNAQLLFNLALQGDGLQVEDLQALAKTYINQRDILPWAGDWLNGRLHLRLAHFDWGSAKLERLSADMNIEQNNLKLQRADAAWAGGKVDAIGRLSLTSAPKVQVAMTLKDVESGLWLRETNNLGQSQFGSQQLAGRMNLSSFWRGGWDSLGQWQTADFALYADAAVTAGELTNVSELRRLGEKLRFSDFDKIKFVDFYTQFKIENRNLLVPNFYLRGDGYNLTAVVRRDFAQAFDMRLKFNTSAVLHNKIKAAVPDMEAAPRAKVDGLNNLYLRAISAAGGLQLRLGKTAVKAELYQEQARVAADFAADFTRQWEQLRAFLGAEATLQPTLQQLLEPPSWGDLPLFGEE